MCAKVRVVRVRCAHRLGLVCVMHTVVRVRCAQRLGLASVEHTPPQWELSRGECSILVRVRAVCVRVHAQSSRVGLFLFG